MGFAFSRQCGELSGEESYASLTASQASSAPSSSPSFVENRKPFWTGPRMVGFVGLFCWFLLGFAMYNTGYAVRGPEGNGLTTAQSVYFMVQLITTVGYGDYVPDTDFGRIVVSFHILYGGLIITGVITEVVAWFLEQHAADAANAVESFLGEEDEEETNCLVASFTAAKPMLWALFYFACAVLVWSSFFVYFCDFLHIDTDLHGDGMHVCEEKGFVEATYMAIVTMTTVGFGDETPRTSVGEVFASIMSVVGIALYLRLVAVTTETILKSKESFRMDAITIEDLDAGDEDGDGQVDLFEFTRFILTKFKIVDPKILKDIEANFKSLDADDSGFLDRDDLELLINKGHHHDASGHRDSNAPDENHQNRNGSRDSNSHVRERRGSNPAANAPDVRDLAASNDVESTKL